MCDSGGNRIVFIFGKNVSFIFSRFKFQMYWRFC